MRNVTVVTDCQGRYVTEGRVLSCGVQWISLALDDGSVRDYRASDEYELVFGGPVEQVNDAREHGGFVMRMIEQRRWNRAADITEL